MERESRTYTSRVAQFRPTRTVSAVAWLLCLALWLPALVLAVLLAIQETTTSEPVSLWIKAACILEVPTVLWGLVSFRSSARVMALLLAVAIVFPSWPHLSLSGIWHSHVSMTLFVATLLVSIVAVASPFKSVLEFANFLRGR